MKKQIVRLIALLIFASATFTSCSVEYRERHHHHYDNNGHNDNNDHRNDHHDHNRDNY